MNDDEHYVIDVPESSESERVYVDVKPRFPVAAQLVLILLIIGGLFAGLIIPKTMALLNRDKNSLNASVVENNESLLATSSASVETIQKLENVSILAESAYVWDIKEQRVLYQKNQDRQLPLASVTKLMTALVAYELVPDDTLATIDFDSVNQESAGTLRVGEVFKVKDLADFALITSHNSAAYTLADAVGEKLGNKDPVAQFVAGMNIRAKELGLNSLEFLNPTGLDVSTHTPGAVGNVRDVTFLMEYIISNYPEILIPTVSRTTRLYNQNGDYHEARNTNRMIQDMPNLIGSKTGYTDLAGGNLIVAIDIGFDRPIIIVVLGSTLDGRFSDVNTLIKAVQTSIVNR